MSESPSKAPAKIAKKKPAAKVPADHPKYIDMVKAAIAALKERFGSSRQAIEKYIKANYKVGDGASTHLKLALKKGVEAEVLVQVKGTGASGSFKLNKEKELKPKKPAKKPVAKKPAAKKPAAKKPAAKKAAAKKQAAKKSTEKNTTKKPAAKKATKPAAKKPAVKKPAAKKAAKKPAKKTAKK